MTRSSRPPSRGGARASTRLGSLSRKRRSGYSPTRSATVETTLRRSEAYGHPLAIAAACTGLGFANARRGASGQAIPLLERALKLCDTYALAVWVPWTASSLGLAYALAGRFEEGAAQAEHAVERGTALGLTRFQPLRLALLANAYLLAGRRAEAHAVAQRVLELAVDCGERSPEAWALYLLAASEEAPRAAAEEKLSEAYRGALRLSEQLGMRPLTARLPSWAGGAVRRAPRGGQGTRPPRAGAGSVPGNGDAALARAGRTNAACPGLSRARTGESSYVDAVQSQSAFSNDRFRETRLSGNRARNPPFANDDCRPTADAGGRSLDRSEADAGAEGGCIAALQP